MRFIPDTLEQRCFGVVVLQIDGPAVLQLISLKSEFLMVLKTVGAFIISLGLFIAADFYYI